MTMYKNGYMFIAAILDMYIIVKSLCKHVHLGITFKDGNPNQIKTWLSPCFHNKETHGLIVHQAILKSYKLKTK